MQGGGRGELPRKLTKYLKYLKYHKWLKVLGKFKKNLKIMRGGAFERLGVLVSGKVFLQWKKIFLMVL